MSHHRVSDREQEADRYIGMKYLSNLFVSTIHLIRIGGETYAIDELGKARVMVSQGGVILDEAPL